MAGTLTFLGIESSCDDTAAAVVRSGERPQILSSVVQGQAALHADFGGVVPEIAARAHVERLDGCIAEALAQAGMGLADLDGIAVTAGPGLIGGVLSGLMTAKALAAATGLPMVGVNHLAGHALTPRLTDALPFPYLMLLFRVGIASSWRSTAPAPIAGWAARSTMPRAKPSTRSPSCWPCRSPAARMSNAKRRRAIRAALPCRARCWTVPAATCRFPG